MQGEIKLNEVIQQRFQGYIGVLQKDLTAAKTILKNKQLKDKVLTDLNFDEAFYYEYKPKLEELP